MPNPVMPEAVYAEILERTTLTRTGAAYMRGRGIPPEFARDLGFRSIDGPGGWAALRRHLAGGFTKETLRAAGFPPDDRGRVWIPFGGLLPMVLIPYRQGGKTVFIRMRTSGPPPGKLLRVIPDWSSRTKRYRSPLDAQPSVPFNADALGRPTVHAVEGEFNTTTLILPEYGLDAVGTPGAGVFDPAWVPLLAGARVVTWFDDDHAGDLARTRLTALFTEVLGAEWVARNLYHMRLPSGADPNHLHVRGMLAPLIHGSPWSSNPSVNPTDSSLPAYRGRLHGEERG
ncbi:MAG TPA: toprim domain-containing protein [Longimicrobium sp.]|nr:toprim domain-containing protein [Longimicrobium sp.]